MARIPTQEFVNPKTGDRCKVNYNDKENIQMLRHYGYERRGGINDAGCHTYKVNNDRRK